MSIIIELSVSENVDEASLPSEEKIKLWAKQSYLGNDDAIVSMQIVGSEEIQSLNKEYRGKNKSTNVLSFPMEIPLEVGLNILGDIVLCDVVITSEAEQQDKSAESHWAHMVVHGMLHLQAYDHIEDNEAAVMEEKEVEIMRSLGFENPY